MDDVTAEVANSAEVVVKVEGACGAAGNEVTGSSRKGALSTAFSYGDISGSSVRDLPPREKKVKFEDGTPDMNAPELRGWHNFSVGANFTVAVGCAKKLRASPLAAGITLSMEVIDSGAWQRMFDAKGDI